MDMFAPVDIYCERLDASYWSEPINAITNLSFILAALWAFRVYRRQQPLSGDAARQDWAVLIAIFFAGLIGLGSFLFHTHATVWASLADVIPIWTFVAYYLFLAIHRIMGVPLLRALRIFGTVLVVICLVLWLVSTVLLASDGQEASSDGFNGSTQYLPGMIALYGFALVMLIKRHAAMGWILAAAITFSLSIFFRTIDIMVCEAFPLGTHFLWHSLNGLFIAFLLQALVRHGHKLDVTAQDGGSQ